MNRFLSTAIACSAGILSVASLAPFSLWPLAFVSASFVFFLLEKTRGEPRQQVVCAFAYSATLFGTGASWVYVSIHEFGYASPGLSLLLTALFCFGLAATNTLLLYFYCRLSERLITGFSLQSALLFTVAMTLIELSRSWLYSGFPWLLQGYALSGTLLQGIAKVLGVYGASIIIFACSAIIVAALSRKDRKHFLRASAVCLCLLSISAALSRFEFSRPIGDERTVSLVQANISQHDKWRPEWRQKTLAVYRDLTRRSQLPAQLILWPEASIPNYLDKAQSELRAFEEQLEESDSALIFGIPSRVQKDQDVEVYNSVSTLGKANGIYHKIHLVPFGEYVPLQNLFGQLMAFFDLPASSMSAGNNQQAPLSVFDWQTRPLVCYEVVFPDLSARAAAVSDVLVTLSNDSWFGRSIGPLQHLQMAQMRAVENERFMLRSTGSGVTAIIDQNGLVTHSAPQFEQAVLQGTFQLREGQTPWTAYGRWLLYGLLALLTLIAVAPNLKRDRD